LSSCGTASWISCCGRSRSRSGRRLQTGLLVQVLQQIVGGELDVLVPPFGGPVYTGDQTGAVNAAKVPVHKGISRLRLVRRAAGQPQMPLGVFVPGMRIEVGVLRFGPRLHLSPVAVEDVLACIDQRTRLGHRGFVEQVLSHSLIVRPWGDTSVTEVLW